MGLRVVSPETIMPLAITLPSLNKKFLHNCYVCFFPFYLKGLCTIHRTTIYTPHLKNSSNSRSLSSSTAIPNHAFSATYPWLTKFLPPQSTLSIVFSTLLARVWLTTQFGFRLTCLNQMITHHSYQRNWRVVFIPYVIDVAFRFKRCVYAPLGYHKWLTFILIITERPRAWHLLRKRVL